MDHPLRPALSQSHVQGLQDQLGAQMRGHRPAHHPTAPGVHHHGQVQEARPGRDVGDVGHPEPIATLGREVPVHQVRGRTALRIPLRGGDLATPTGSPQPRLTHQASHPLAAHQLAASVQFGVDPRSPIRAPRTCVDSSDSCQKLHIGPRMRRARTTRPCVVSTGGDAQQLTHPAHPVLGLVGAHESEDLDGIDPVSRANQAAAFARISRSSRS
jgi:hypothetical protein